MGRPVPDKAGALAARMLRPSIVARTCRGRTWRVRASPVCPTAPSAVHAAPPHTNRMTRGSSWEGVALPDPPAGEGMGEPGFPIPLREGVALPDPPAGGGMGEPGSPMFTVAVHAAAPHGRRSPAKAGFTSGTPRRESPGARGGERNSSSKTIRPPPPGRGARFPPPAGKRQGGGGAGRAAAGRTAIHEGAII